MELGLSSAEPARRKEQAAWLRAACAAAATAGQPAPAPAPSAKELLEVRLPRGGMQGQCALECYTP